MKTLLATKRFRIASKWERKRRQITKKKSSTGWKNNKQNDESKDTFLHFINIVQQSTHLVRKKAIPVARCGGRYFNGYQKGQAGKSEDSKRDSVSIVFRQQLQRVFSISETKSVR